MSLALRRDDYRAFLEEQLSIECPRMEVRRNGEQSASYTGGGEIRQSSDGGLEFVLYDNSCPEPELIWGGRPAGTWLQENDFYELAAVSIDGKNWTAERIIPTTDSLSGQSGAIVRGRLSELTCTIAVPPAARAFVGFSRDIEQIPTNTQRRAVSVI